MSILGKIGAVFAGLITMLSGHATMPVPTPAQSVSTMQTAEIHTIAARQSVSKTPIHKKDKSSRSVVFKHITPTPMPVPQATSSNATAAPIEHPTPQGVSKIDPTTLNIQTRAALVNIICTAQTAGALEPISGSGVLIDSRGIVLTNAHVAQYFLLRDYPFAGNIQCLVRAGSPAGSGGTYSAELLYLPSVWIDKNASQITAQVPAGTGEDDLAFLRITGSVDGSALPSAFPHLSMGGAFPETGEQMFLASYPAGFLSGAFIQESLYASSAYATVGQRYVFNNGNSGVDLFSVPGTIVSQEGSSGGAVVRAGNGELAGIITTETQASQTSARDLRALTLYHINAALQQFGQGGIVGLLTGDTTAKAAAFSADIAPDLTQKLIQALTKTS